jgi:hypothetical protein
MPLFRVDADVIISSYFITNGFGHNYVPIPHRSRSEPRHLKNKKQQIKADL